MLTYMLTWTTRGLTKALETLANSGLAPEVGLEPTTLWNGFLQAVFQCFGTFYGAIMAFFVVLLSAMLTWCLPSCAGLLMVTPYKPQRIKLLLPDPTLSRSGTHHKRNSEPNPSRTLPCTSRARGRENGAKNGSKGTTGRGEGTALFIISKPARLGCEKWGYRVTSGGCSQMHREGWTW